MIALGTPVTYHHRAAVARWVKDDYSGKKIWRLLEGVGSSEYGWPGVPVMGLLRDLFLKWPEIKADFSYGAKNQMLNKTIMVWPEEGSGVVIGRVRRGRGVSERSYGNGEDHEQGYFNATSWFNLFAVKHDLGGMDYVLVPEWAVIPVHHQ